MSNNYWIATIALSICPAAFGASFDCAKASSVIEKMICTDRQLSDLDEKLGSSYRNAASNAKTSMAVKARQRAWLIEVRNKCQDAPCLERAYTMRLAELSDAEGMMAEKEMTIVGRIEWGKMTSSVSSETGAVLIFESKSEVANQIFKACKVEDICEVIGTVEHGDVLTRIRKVHKLKSAQQVVPQQAPAKPQDNSIPKPEAARSPEEEQAAALKQHWNDPLIIDYTLAIKGIGGMQKKSRPAAGTLRKINLGQYINWERDASSAWKFQLWNAMGMQNKNSVYNQCLQEVAQQWIDAFGYKDTVLRSSMFANGNVDINKALRIICSPG